MSGYSKDYLSPVWLMLLFGIIVYSVGGSRTFPSLSRDLQKRPEVASYPPVQDLLLSIIKRWDFQTDGCHCNGYSFECNRDLFCQRRNKSRHWSCQKTCCGLKCVAKN
ncbi:unnamed protein product [Lymnaea stagnalis]|uniref:Uncharacterized protein n=1 Tax=Lymnaea stagnalis TaxID=6523 RepID=A0AAV2I7J6_LYMST